MSIISHINNITIYSDILETWDIIIQHINNIYLNKYFILIVDNRREKVAYYANNIEEIKNKINNMKFKYYKITLLNSLNNNFIDIDEFIIKDIIKISLDLIEYIDKNNITKTKIKTLFYKKVDKFIKTSKYIKNYDLRDLITKESLYCLEGVHKSVLFSWMGIERTRDLCRCLSRSNPNNPYLIRMIMIIKLLITLFIFNSFVTWKLPSTKQNQKYTPSPIKIGIGIGYPDGRQINLQPPGPFLHIDRRCLTMGFRSRCGRLPRFLQYSGYQKLIYNCINIYYKKINKKIRKTEHNINY